LIKINDFELNFRENMTVRDAMNEAKFIFPMVIVSVNDQLIPNDQLDTHKIADGDAIKVFHMESGG
jgi:thiamine biosynthesis protein ThiS